MFALIEYPFPWRNAEQGLELFPPELQQDPLVYYHGTLAINGESIARTGFEVPKGHRGVSFAQKSRDSLIWALNRDTERRGAVVMAVRFGARPQPRGGGGECGLGMAVAGGDVYVYDAAMLPTPFGICRIPRDYPHGSIMAGTV